jgi:hypothetical protein
MHTYIHTYIHTWNSGRPTMCPHTTIYLILQYTSYYNIYALIRRYTSVILLCVLIHLYTSYYDVSSYYYIPHTTIYVPSYVDIPQYLSSTPGPTLATSPPSSSYSLYARGSRCSSAPPLGADFTCFTSTKVLYARGSRCSSAPPLGALILLALLVQMYSVHQCKSARTMHALILLALPVQICTHLFYWLY